MRIGRTQKTITFIVGVFLAIVCSLLSAKLIMDKYEKEKYSRQNIQTANTNIENAPQSASQGANDSFWTNYSPQEVTGLVVFAGFTVAVIAFGFVWIISLAIGMLTGGTSKLSTARS